MLQQIYIHLSIVRILSYSAKRDAFRGIPRTSEENLWSWKSYTCLVRRYGNGYTDSLTDYPGGGNRSDVPPRVSRLHRAAAQLHALRLPDFRVAGTPERSTA